MTVSRGATVWVLGSGGREHALAWKLARSPEVSRVCVVPGNDGMCDQDGKKFERVVADLTLGRLEFERLAAQAREESVSLVVVGPDDPLAAGVVDAFEAAGVVCFGPTARAARLEASKLFSKEIMLAAGVPTAAFHVAEDLAGAQAILEKLDWTSGKFWVLKADGLALGKGVAVCSNLAEARQALPGLSKMGRVLIEEGLRGQELSWFGICDGQVAALLEPARDYKRIGTGDRGPNTGGMGAISPVPGVPRSWSKRVREEIFEPVLREMRKLGSPFKGLLYAGLMVDPENERFWVLEFNARFGDPETQAILPRMDEDLYRWCLASARGQLAGMGEPRFFNDSTALVVMAAKGYPEAAEKGARIEGPELLPPAYFSAGFKQEGAQRVVSGGRVLGALGQATSLSEATAQAYERASRVRFDGAQMRLDIGGGAT